MSAMRLLGERRFGPLFITQFLGAFNDNLYKNALVILLTFQAAGWTKLPPVLLTNLAAGLFILPFFLFSASAGLLADKFDKARLARVSKGLEIAIALIAGTGFAMKSLAVLLTALFLLGLQSTLFGPVKYAILPQHLKAGELVQGNALVEAATFAAILLGTLAGGILATIPGGPAWISLASLAVALTGYATSRRIPVAPAPEPGLRLNFNPVTETWRCINFAHENRLVFTAILGISWFWFYGSLLLAQFPVLTKDLLGGGESLATLLLTVFAIGIGGGSLLCGKLSHERPDLRLSALGAAGMILACLDLALACTAAQRGHNLPLATLLSSWPVWRVLLDLLAIGLAGGLYGVPLYAVMQRESNPKHRARVIAANNVLNALFMVLAALLAILLLKLGCTIPQLFVFAAAATTLAAAGGWVMLRRR